MAERPLQKPRASRTSRWPEILLAVLAGWILAVLVYQTFWASRVLGGSARTRKMANRPVDPAKVVIYRPPADRKGPPLMLRLAYLLEQRPDLFSPEDLQALVDRVGIRRDERLLELERQMVELLTPAQRSRLEEALEDLGSPWNVEPTVAPLKAALELAARRTGRTPAAPAGIRPRGKRQVSPHPAPFLARRFVAWEADPSLRLTDRQWGDMAPLLAAALPLEAAAMAWESRLLDVTREIEALEQQVREGLRPEQRRALEEVEVPEATDRPAVWPSQGLDELRETLERLEGEAESGEDGLPSGEEPREGGSGEPPRELSGDLEEQVHTLQERGYYLRALRLVEEARAARPGDPEVERIWRRLSLVADPARLVAEPGRAAEPSSEGGDLSLAVMRHEARVTSALAGGTPEEVARAVTAARPLVQTLLERDPAARGDALALLGAFALIESDWEGSAELLEQALAAGIPNFYRELDVRMALVYVRFRQDRMDEARRHLEGALDRLRSQPEGEADYRAAVGFWENLQLYRMVYYGELLEEEDFSVRDPLYAKLKAAGVREDSPGFAMRSLLSQVSSALRRDDPWAALEAWEGPEAEQDILSGGDEVHSLFGYACSIPMLSHAEALLSGDLHRAVGDRVGAEAFYRDALVIFPDHPLARERLEALR